MEGGNDDNNPQVQPASSAAIYAVGNSFVGSGAAGLIVH
jgi:hypothetical protein